MAWRSSALAKPAADGRRLCRTCGERYDYPGHNSLATRTVCERCLEIPADTRRVLGILRRRVEQLTKQVEGLTERAGEERSG
jgi:hypothetical protein